VNKLIQLTLGLLLLAVGTTHAAGTPAVPAVQQTIEVTAQQLEALQQQGQAIFSGEVIAKQGELTLYCDKLVIYSLVGQQKVDRLEAFGKVRVVQLDRTATADKVIYRQQQGTLMLIGNAQLHQGQNQVAGEEITLFLEENRSIVKGGDGGRVKAVLFPEPQKVPQ